MLGNSLRFAFRLETLGQWGPLAKNLYKEICNRFPDATHDWRAATYFA